MGKLLSSKETEEFFKKNPVPQDKTITKPVNKTTTKSAPQKK